MRRCYNVIVPRLFRRILSFGFVLILSVTLYGPTAVNAQSIDSGVAISISPSSSNVVVGDVFSVSIFLDTNSRIINTIDAILRFPPDKLQVVSPSVGKSIIGIWTAPPSFNNLTGELHFQGGIPSPGINTSNGLISTVTFRAKSVGSANISFSGDSKILLNDGFGTNALTGTQGATINLGLPVPAGPIVASNTHPNQGEWYRIRTAVLQWDDGYAPAGGYSYVLNDTPVDIPDDISEGSGREISYKNLSDGFHYFHIKALRGGNWGGVTHYSIKIDSTEPAEFNIKVLPKARTSSHFPIFDFNTTDVLSGTNHYELRIVPLDIENAERFNGANEEGFFIEVDTRYIPDVELGLGKYDVIVRAYDNAGNFRESIKRVSIINPIITATSDGLNLMDRFVIPWLFIAVAGALILVLLLVLGVRERRKHREISLRRIAGALDDPVIRRRIKELQRRKESYDATRHKIAAIALIATLSIFAVPWVRVSNAQEVSSLPPPIITTISESISNDQIFYVGGQTDVADSEVIIFIQNIQDGQVISDSVVADKRGDWFYARKEPLMRGSYLLWSQLRVGSQLSPPSPQKQISVSQTAFQLGASRLSLETLYLLSTFILFAVVIILGGFVFFHFYHRRRKHGELQQEIREADAVIKSGFITLHEDINAELKVIHKAKLNKTLSEQEKDREERLLKDLEEIEEFIKKEFRDVKLKSREI